MSLAYHILSSGAVAADFRNFLTEVSTGLVKTFLLTCGRNIEDHQDNHPPPALSPHHPPADSKSLRLYAVYEK